MNPTTPHTTAMTTTIIMIGSIETGCVIETVAVVVLPALTMDVCVCGLYPSFVICSVYAPTATSVNVTVPVLLVTALSGSAPVGAVVEVTVAPLTGLLLLSVILTVSEPMVEGSVVPVVVMVMFCVPTPLVYPVLVAFAVMLHGVALVVFGAVKTAEYVPLPS